MSPSAASRPTVSVYSSEDENQVVTTLPLPEVFNAPIRPDVVNFVHTNMRKNKRQAYAVAVNAGHQTAAESWGTGRAVSRIARVPGGGTHRAGQGAFGNMCRGGRMFNPTKVWRKWHRRVNRNQRRYAVSSALAASAVTPLVMARGHRISQVPEMPLVVGGSIESTMKTSQAYKLLQKFGADEDSDRAKESIQIRSGKGKMRNRRYVSRRGPLVVYHEAQGVEKAFRNLPGVQLAQVDRLNLLDLAPGGHLGRFIIWTQGAFEKLDSIFGTQTRKSKVKSNYVQPRHIVSNADIARIINSDEIQKVVRPAKLEKSKPPRKKNPLKNPGVMVKLNPYALAHRRAEARIEQARAEKKAETLKKKRKSGNTKQQRQQFFKKITKEDD